MQVAILNAEYGTVSIFKLPENLRAPNVCKEYVINHMANAGDQYIIAENIQLTDHRPNLD